MSCCTEALVLYSMQRLASELIPRVFWETDWRLQLLYTVSTDIFPTAQHHCLWAMPYYVNTACCLCETFQRCNMKVAWPRIKLMNFLLQIRHANHASAVLATTVFCFIGACFHVYPQPHRLSRRYCTECHRAVSYTHLTLPTNREV